MDDNLAPSYFVALPLSQKGNRSWLALSHDVSGVHWYQGDEPRERLLKQKACYIKWIVGVVYMDLARSRSTILIPFPPPSFRLEPDSIMTTLDPTLFTGPLLLGHLINLFLYGIELVQFYRYNACFPNERTWTRRLVYAVVLLDTAQTAFAIHNAWQILGSGWGNPQEILNPEWSWGSVPLFTGLVSLLVQGFYALRISKLIDSRLTRWIVTIVLGIATTQAVCGVFSGIYYALGSLTGTSHVISAVTTVWLGGSALCDLVISGTIVAFLLVQVSGFTQTNNVVQKVIKMTIETGTITTSAAATDLVLFLLYPKNNLHLIFCIPLAKLYSNTLIAMLNARKSSLLPGTSLSTHTIPIMINQTTHSISFVNSAHSRGDSTASLPKSSDVAAYVQLPGSSPAQRERSLPPTPPSKAHQFSRPSTGTPLTPQPTLFKPPHKRTESTQRLTESFPNPLATATATTPAASTNKGWKKHLNKPLYLLPNTNDDLNSHLDLTIDTPFRTRFLNKFQGII